MALKNKRPACPAQSLKEPSNIYKILTNRLALHHTQFLCIQGKCTLEISIQWYPRAVRRAQDLYPLASPHGILYEMTYDFMNLLANPIRHSGKILLQARHESLHILLHLLWRKPYLSYSRPYYSHLLSILRGSDQVLHTARHVFGYSPCLRTRHQALWPQNPSQVRLHEFWQTIFMAEQPFELNSAFLYSI